MKFTIRPAWPVGHIGAWSEVVEASSPLRAVQSVVKGIPDDEDGPTMFDVDDTDGKSWIVDMMDGKPLVLDNTPIQT